MGFELMIWNANKSAVLNTITQATPSGLDGGFKWQLRGNGDTVQLDLAGRNDRLKLPPRGVVRLKVDGGAAFYGIVPDPPSGDSQVVEQVQVLGGREALRVTLLDGAVYRDQGVFQIVRDVLTRLCPPALAYVPTLIGDGTGTDAGPELSLYYAPTSDLVTALDGLAKSANTGWGVDNQGRVFFGRPAPAPLAVPYVRQPWRRLPVQGREAVTRAVLRVVSAPSVPSGTMLGDNYLPRTVTVTALHADHALYQASISVPVPEGVSVIRGFYVAPETGSQRPDNPAPVTNAANMVDGDPETYATVPIGYGNYVGLNSEDSRVVGYRLTYVLPEYQRLGASDFTTYIRRASIDSTLNLDTSNGRQTIVVIVPPGTEFTEDIWRTLATVESSVYSNPPSPMVNMKIYDFQLLMVDDPAALRLAESFLQSPFAKPTEITLDSLEPPTPAVTVTGSPDGDVTGDTGIWEYTHQPGGLRRTLIRIGTDGQAPAARAIKLAVKAAR